MKTKKKLLIWIVACIIAVTACSVSISSCSSDEGLDAATSQPSEFEALMCGLNEYSAQFVSSHTAGSRRGDLGWSRFKESVKADHVGYNNGSAVISISASREKWNDLKKDGQLQIVSYDMSTQDIAVITAQVDSLKNVYEMDPTNIGAIHNAAILQSLLDYDMGFETTEELVQSVVGALHKLGVSLPGFDFHATVREVDDFFKNIYDDDISVMYSRLAVKYPEKQEQYEILDQYLSTTEVLNSVEDIAEFSDGYATIIDQSSIAPKVKQDLKKNISIAPSSHQLWREMDTISK